MVMLGPTRKIPERERERERERDCGNHKRMWHEVWYCTVVLRYPQTPETLLYCKP